MARFTEAPKQVVSALDSGGADAARALSAELSKFSQKAGDARREVVSKESFDAGLAAGLEGAEPVRGSDLASEAFNKGLTQSFLSGVDNDSRQEIARIASEHPADPIKFSALVESYREGTVSSLPEQMQTQAALNLDNQINRAFVQVQGNAIQAQKNELLSELQNNTDAAMEEAGALARMGDDFSATEEFEKGAATIDAMDIPASKKAEMKKAYKLEQTEQTYKGVNDRIYEDKGIKGVNQWLTKNESKPRNGASADEWDAITDAIQADANRKESRKNALKAASKTDLRNRLKQYEISKSLGWKVNRSDEIELTRAISGHSDLVDRKKIVDKTATFSVLSQETRQEMLSEMQTGQLDDVNMRVSLEKANQEVNKLAQKDGYSLGVNQGLIDAVPLDLGNPESVAARVEQIQMLEEHYGASISPLMDSEATQLVAGLETMTPQDKVQLALTFQDTPGVWGQLDSKNAGAFAMAGATGDQMVMSEVFKGEELIKNKLVKNLSPNDYLAEFDDLVEGVYEPSDRRALLDSALKYYASTSASAIDGVFDSGDFQNAVQAVSGGIGNVNGFKIELPRGVDEDTFDDFIDELQPETIEAMGGIANFTNEDAVDAIQAGRIRSVGNNEYIIETGGGGFFTDKAVTTLFGANGEPFIFSYKPDEAAKNNAIATERAFQTRREIRNR